LAPVHPRFSRVTAKPVAGVPFALALIDASVLGASAMPLSTAYVMGDVLTVRHSLHCL
jgi:Mn2+/Fe2+ NRAMP family transporter